MPITHYQLCQVLGILCRAGDQDAGKRLVPQMAAGKQICACVFSLTCSKISEKSEICYCKEVEERL